MLSITDKIKAIDAFNAAYSEHGLKNIPIPKDGFPETMELDRWLALDICRVINDHRKELIKNASNQ
jgi:hypothetical protein